jgi:hypothetical protein
MKEHLHERLGGVARLRYRHRVRMKEKHGRGANRQWR